MKTHSLSMSGSITAITAAICLLCAYQSGGFGAALSFDGTNDYVRFSGSLFPNVTNTFTMELWVNPNGSRATTIESNSGVTGNGGERYAIFPEQGQLAYGASTHAGAGISVGTNGVSICEHADNYLPSLLVYTGSLAGWIHVAVVYSNGQPRLFLNGNLVRTGLTSTKIVHPSANLGETGQGYGYYRGILDEVRLWKTALDPATIQAWQNKELDATHPAYANLIGYWRLNENTGTNTVDSSSAGHHGSLQNGPSWVTPGAPITGLGDPIVTTEPVSELTNTSGVLNGTVNPQGSLTTCWFDWGPSTNYGSATPLQSVGAGQTASAFSQLLANLSPVTTYHFRLAGSNTAGVSRGVDQQLTTLGPPTVTTLAAEVPSLTTAILHGSVIANGHPTTAWFDWGVTTNYGSSTVFQSTGSSLSNVPVSQAITGLPAGHDYHFRIVATNDSGLAVGLDQQFWTQTFSNAAVLRTDASRGNVYWGDFDNDGSLDLLALVAYFTNGYTALFRNVGNSFIAQSNAPGPYVGSAGAWGDYDNNGSLDFALSGYPIFDCCGPTSRVYQNIGATLTNIGATLPGVAIGAVAWADFDNDGLLDLLVCGSQSTYYVDAPFTRLYRNRGGAFKPTAAGFPGIANGALAWGDFDNDGDLDLLFMGDTGAGLITRVFRNDHGMFTDIVAELPGVAFGSVAWGDFDGDGWLDILLAGSTNNSASGAICKIYRNNHDGTFSDSGAILPGVYQGSAVWGDYDNDGQLDVLVTGVPSASGEPSCYIFRNEKGALTDIGATLTNALVGAWGDYDNDGMLDIALIGEGQYAYYGNLSIFRNYLVATNTITNAPSPPSGLAVTVLNNGATMVWNAASDPHTPTSGLTYNVRVGTAPGGAQILPPHSDPVTGHRRLPQMGNAQQRLFSMLTNLTVGTYYWSVQTVNNSFLGSSWAPEQSFAITTGPPVSVTLAASNIFCCSAQLSGLVTPGGLATQAWFEWGATTNLDNLTPLLDLSPELVPRLVSQSINNLQPRTRYYFRTVATNGAGSIFGATQSFTTQVPAPSATTLGSSNVSYTSAALFGYAASSNSPGQFYIEWGLTTNYGNLDLAIGNDAALLFDGTDDLVKVGSSVFSDIENNFTLELWAYPTAARVETPESASGAAGVSGQRYAVFPDHGITYANGVTAGMGLSVGTNGVSVMEHSDSYLPSVLVRTGSLSGWTHIAVAYSNQVPRLYLNGILVRVGLVSGKIVFPSADLGDGPDYYLGYGPFQGSIQEVRLWDVPLNAATIQAWMNQSVTTNHPSYPHLQGYWPCNEGIGLTIVDAGARGFSGQLVNGTSWTGGRRSYARAFSVTLSGLSPGTTYHFRAFAMNSGGVSYGADQVFTTLPLPRVLAIGVQSGPNFFLSFTGLANRAYVLETSTNLFQWGPLTNLSAEPDGLFEYLDTSASNFVTRFYRLRVP